VVIVYRAKWKSGKVEKSKLSLFNFFHLYHHQYAMGCGNAAPHAQVPCLAA
jgi:hypothetical protein